MPTPSAPWVNDGQITTIWAEGGTPPPTSCDNYYGNRRVADYFYKECPTGQVGSGVYFIVPAGRFWSTESQAAADSQAIAYMEQAGQEAVNLTGECKLGDFTEVFTSMQAALHWDWIGDKGVASSLPFYGRSFLTTTAYSLTPLLNCTFFKGTDGSALGVAAGRILPFTIEPTYGSIHLDFKDFEPSRADLLGAGWVTTGTLASNLVPFQTYGGFLLGDFGSAEIYGDEDGEGAWTLGGMLGIVETASSFNQVFSPHPTDATKPGHFNGYIIAYKEVITIYKWSDALVDYEVIGTIDFDLRERTTYVGYGIRYDQGQWAAEIYLNGAWQYSIFDEDVVSFTMMRYQRGVLSMDYWIGDLIIGSMSPFTNRVPPALTVKNFAPEEIYVDYPIPERPAHFFPVVTQGTATDLIDGISGPSMLRVEQPEKSIGFSALSESGGSFQSPTAVLGLRWDPNLWDEVTLGQQERLFGCAPFLALRWTRVYEAHFPYGMNRTYEGHLDLPNEQTFFNIDEADFPAIIPTLSVFDTDPYNDIAYNQATQAKCLPAGFDRPTEAIDLLEPYSWESMEQQVFPFSGTMYTKDYIASRWIYYYLNPQMPDPVPAVPEVFNLHITKAAMFSGVRGIRTRLPMPAPVYDVPNCPYPTCQVLPTTDRILQTFPASFTGGGSTFDLSTTDLCDTLFPGIRSVEQGEWNWDIAVSDFLDGTTRKIRISLSMVSAKLMDDYLLSSAQLLPLTNPSPVRFIAWRTDWPLPVWDTIVTMTSYTLTVPPPPPSGGPGMPPSATVVYEFDGTLEDHPSFADLDGSFYFHLMGGY